MRKQHKKIAIVGCAGSGKTTLAIKLKEKLKLPLYHLDLFYWSPGWQRIGLDKFTKIHNELCDQKEWIIEGSYIKVLDYRALQADVLIFLDLPRYQCLLNVFKRLILNLGKVMADSPKNCPQRFNLEFIKWVWDFNKRNKQMILEILDNYSHKEVYILRSFKKMDILLNMLLY